MCIKENIVSKRGGVGTCLIVNRGKMIILRTTYALR